MTQRPFGLDDDGRPFLRVHSDKAGDSIRFGTLGADDDVADTMFVIKSAGSRVMTRRPEPLLVEFLEMILDQEEFRLSINGDDRGVIDLRGDRWTHIGVVTSDVEDGLKDAPLGS